MYRDPWLVAVHKPSGLLVHRSPIDRRETRFALQEVRNLIGQRVWPVHRLDKPTSGLLLFALDPDSARVLSDQFAEGQIDKRYLAVVRGHCPESLEIDHPLQDEVDSRGRTVADGAVREARTTLTRRRLWTLPIPVDRYPEARYSLVELTPHTGRYRQLRRHMKHIAHPIIGDTRYGKGTHNRFFRSHLDSCRLLLASVGLELRHPVSEQTLVLECPLAPDFTDTIDQLDGLAVRRQVD